MPAISRLEAPRKKQRKTPARSAPAGVLKISGFVASYSLPAFPALVGARGTMTPTTRTTAMRNIAAARSEEATNAARPDGNDRDIRVNRANKKYGQD
jgi:hypothetical protein